MTIIINKDTKDNKDNKYSLQNSKNYKTKLEYEPNIIAQKYVQLLIEYLIFIRENIKITNIHFSKFIILRGLDTITSVFSYILDFTKNIDLTYYHCQKSYYFYVEFISQISEDDKLFLKLTSRDATTYVYKKTIFNINNKYKKEDSGECREKMHIIQQFINVYQTYLIKIIQTNNTEIENIDHIKYISEELKKVTNKEKISILENITEKLYYKIEDTNCFFKINELLVKNMTNTDYLRNIERKILSEEFHDKLENDTFEKFSDWFLL